MPKEIYENAKEKFLDRYEKIKDWVKPEPPSNLYRYGNRRNKVS